MHAVRCASCTAGLAVALGGGTPLCAQFTATTDLTLGAVHYQGFLGSGALSVAPGIRYDSRSFSVAAQGSYLLYESGRSLAQGVGAGAWLSPSLAGVRAELSGFGGLSGYADAPVAGYGLGRVRLHAMQQARGVWVAAGLGQAYVGSHSAGTSELSVGAWTSVPGFAVTVAAIRSTAADSAFTDLTASVRWLRGGLEVDGQVGVRPWSAGGQEGLFGEVMARLAITRVVAAQVAAGRYLADPLRGAVAGRYLSAGVRLTLAGGRSPTRAADERLRWEVRLPAPLPADAPELTVSESPFGMRTFTIHAPGAAQVELASDFTDWEPVAMQRVGGDRWTLSARLAAGIYRINVRADRGPWRVPRGATPVQDEFGAVVGLLIVR